MKNNLEITFKNWKTYKIDNANLKAIELLMEAENSDIDIIKQY